MLERAEDMWVKSFNKKIWLRVSNEETNSEYFEYFDKNISVRFRKILDAIFWNPVFHLTTYGKY